MNMTSLNHLTTGLSGNGEFFLQVLRPSKINQYLSRKITDTNTDQTETFILPEDNSENKREQCSSRTTLPSYQTTRSISHLTCWFNRCSWWVPISLLWSSSQNSCQWRRHWCLRHRVSAKFWVELPWQKRRTRPIVSEKDISFFLYNLSILLWIILLFHFTSETPVVLEVVICWRSSGLWGTGWFVRDRKVFWFVRDSHSHQSFVCTRALAN